MSNEEDYRLNFIFLGSSQVGKTSIILRYAEEKFYENFASTIGVDVKSKLVIFKRGAKFLVKLWDTAGQEKFGTVGKSYYKNSHGAFLVFDITQKETFKCLDKWVEEIKNEKEINTHPIVLLGNKTDELPSDDSITEEEIYEFANNVNAKYFPVSAKTGNGIKEAFTYMITTVIKKLNLVDNQGNLLNGSESFLLRNKKSRDSSCCS